MCNACEHPAAHQLDCIHAMMMLVGNELLGPTMLQQLAVCNGIIVNCPFILCYDALVMNL